MRICSLLPSATEIVADLGLGFTPPRSGELEEETDGGVSAGIAAGTCEQDGSKAFSWAEP
jgi:hypothetical protein